LSPGSEDPDVNKANEMEKIMGKLESLKFTNRKLKAKFSKLYKIKEDQYEIDYKTQPLLKKSSEKLDFLLEKKEAVMKKFKMIHNNSLSSSSSKPTPIGTQESKE